jgi:hypothetical protein
LMMSDVGIKMAARELAAEIASRLQEFKGLVPAGSDPGSDALSRLGNRRSGLAHMLRRLERVERDCSRLADRTSGAMQSLCRCTAKLAHEYIESLKMAGNSADVICKCLGRLAR